MQQPPQQLLLIGLDTGVASLLPKAQTWLANGGRVALLASCASVSAIVELESWYALKNQYLAQITLLFVLRDEPQLYPILEGELDFDRLAQLQPAVFDAVQVQQAVLVGPASWIAHQQQSLERLGVASKKIERLAQDTPAGNRDRGASQEQPVAPTVAVRVTLQGREFEFGMNQSGATVLDAAEDAGLDLPFSCRGGVCSTCRTRVLDGSVSMLENTSLDGWELENGYVLACQAVPTSARLHISYDEV